MNDNSTKPAVRRVHGYQYEAPGTMTNQGRLTLGIPPSVFCLASVVRSSAARENTMRVAVIILVAKGTCCRKGKNDIAGIVVLVVVDDGNKDKDGRKGE